MSEVSRRQAIAMLGVGGIVAALPMHALGDRWLLLLDPGLPTLDLQAAMRLHPGALVVWLKGDLVRLWASELGENVIRAGRSSRAVVRYDKAVLLAGLARETGLRTVRTEVRRGTFHLVFARGPTRLRA